MGNSDRIESFFPDYSVGQENSVAFLKSEEFVLAFLYLEAKCNVSFAHTQSWRHLVPSLHRMEMERRQTRQAVSDCCEVTQSPETSGTST